MLVSFRNFCRHLFSSHPRPTGRPRIVPVVEGLGERIVPAATTFSTQPAPIVLTNLQTTAQSDSQSDNNSGGAGTVHHSDFTFTTTFNKASPMLF